MEKIPIECNTVQETLVIPLYARVLCAKVYPNLFRDEKAEELMARLDYDFGALERKSNGMMYRFGALETAMRQFDLAWEVRDYLKTHPEAAVVNLGCGLDLTGENCDNGRCKIYNLDFPDVIALRERLLPGGERIQNLAVDLNDRCQRRSGFLRRRRILLFPNRTGKIIIFQNGKAFYWWAAGI